jgi:serine O-acetyltransferase
MKKVIVWLYNTFKLGFNLIRLSPHIVILQTCKNRSIIKYDVTHWLSLLNKTLSINRGFIYLMSSRPEFRNLFYKRIGHISELINWICPKMDTLFINTNANNIGPGLFLQHGFSTIISAKSIGKDCWINQQVTIGFSDANSFPTLGDNVVINAGAKIIGNVHMGNNSHAGANAVVVKNVPDNCTVVGVPAYIIKRNGVKVKENL